MRSVKTSISKAFHDLFKQGMRESNSHQKFWRLLSYHLTNPLYVINIPSKSHTVNYFSKFFLFPSILLSPLGYALDRLVTVSSIHYCTSTSVLSTSSSSRGLTTCVGISHLEGGFTLRCLQRLSRPGLATLPCTWQCNRYTSGQSTPVLSY